MCRCRSLVSYMTINGGIKVRPYLSQKFQGAIFELLARSLQKWRPSERRSIVQQGGARYRRYLYYANLCSCHDPSGPERFLSDMSHWRRGLCHWLERVARANKCNRERKHKAGSNSEELWDDRGFNKIKEILWNFILHPSQFHSLELESDYNATHK